ncbi:MAG: metallopeptidase TldD-related protein [Thermoanaerobaculia bacterium]
MSWARLDTAAMSRALAAIADREGDIAEIYCERRTDAEWPATESATGVRVRREQGLSVRLLRERRAWIASRDGLTRDDLAEALRQVARTQPAAMASPEIACGPDPAVPVSALKGFASEVERALRRHHVAFPMRIAARWHRRDLQVVGPRWVPPAEREIFFSLDVDLPWGRYGGLWTELDAGAAEHLARILVGRFRAREAVPPDSGVAPLWFSPPAAAVLLHEAVAHALEADVLARDGAPDGAIGVALAPPEIDVLDDPRRAPRGVDRATDDEGQPVVRRWLLRGGRVDQPIADLAHAARSQNLLAGSGFRGDRHAAPLPRLHHVELLTGSASEEALLRATGDGLFVPEVDAGALDAATGEFRLRVPWGRLIQGGELGALTGPFLVRGRVAELFADFRALGNDPRPAGAGWCAKGGQRRAVWATAPSIVLGGLAVEGAGSTGDDA